MSEIGAECDFMFEKTIYYTGKQIDNEKLFLLQVATGNNDLSNYIYASINIIDDNDKILVTKVELINNIFNCLYSLNIDSLKKISSEDSQILIKKIEEYLINTYKSNENIYKKIIGDEGQNNQNDKKSDVSLVNNDIYTANKIKVLNFINEMGEKNARGTK
jgi:hypothetical protein